MARKATRAVKGDRCPTGHKLPHRTDHGRCSPHDCADQESLPFEVVVSVPIAPSFKPGEERMHVLKRLEQVAPAMLEARIKAAQSGDAAAQDALLDRAGFTRKPEGGVDFNGPVLVLQPEQLKLPWGGSAQHGRLVEAGTGATRAGLAEPKESAASAAAPSVQPVPRAHQPEPAEAEPGPVHRVRKSGKAAAT